MAGSGSGVEIDTSDLEADVRRLAAGIERVANDAPRDAAQNVAQSLRADLPVRTGRLVRSVQVVSSTDGAGVSYGSGIPYADYIEKRTGAAAHAVGSADSAFVRDCQNGLEQEARKI